MGIHSVEKKQLSATGMLQKVRSIFKDVPEPPKGPQGAKTQIPLSDCLMSGLAVFGLKFPSLLQFDDSQEDDTIKHNLLDFPLNPKEKQNIMLNAWKN